MPIGAHKKEVRDAIVSALGCIRPQVEPNKITRAITAQQYAKVTLACSGKNNQDFRRRGFHCERQAIDQSVMCVGFQVHKNMAMASPSHKSQWCVLACKFLHYLCMREQRREDGCGKFIFFEFMC